MAPTNSLLQLLDSCNQLCDSLLQPHYCILAVLKGGLLKTQKTLKLDNVSLEDLVLIGPTIDPLMG